MTLIKGRIDRKGSVRFHDASISIWEEGISTARAAGGSDGADAWEREFKRDVFGRIVQQLRRLGWSVCMSEIVESDVKHYGGKIARWAAERHRDCRKGDLFGELSVSGRMVEFKMWQSLNTPKRPDHGGKYESDKEGLMPYLLRLEMERTRRRIREYLCNVFTGYVFEPSRHLIRGVNGLTAPDWIEATNKASGHYKDGLGHADGHNSPYNNRAADGGVVQHGARVWFADSKGRLCVGTAYYHINNMWWVATGRYDCRNIASFDLYTKQPDNLRLKRNAKLRRSRLEKEMAGAVGAMAFERAAQLRDILFPGAPDLYVVWHREHGLYHREGFCGYTADKSQAGRFTADEVRGWDRDPNQVMPLTTESKVAA